ncbi:lipoprotein insertase outer membrane protein LolB [Marinobacterium aestuariivivens]|uniref:Outer-membrane lipoprotein LolB n=1 Tax=Marinobacterium aestuariivivens TaxID=1698799 RepID=A0ABW2A1E0_9GAMM
MRLGCTLMLALILAGCSTFKPQTPMPGSGSWEDYQRRALALETWALDGKIGIRTGQDSHSARLQWQQRPGDYRILISGPLGQGGALIEGSDQGVIIDVAGEGRYRASSPEGLLQELLGWSFPVQQATYWVRGLPAPGLPYSPGFRENRLETLEQGGWLIHYSGYSQQGDPGLPERIRLRRADLTITVIIKDWELSSATESQSKPL